MRTRSLMQILRTLGAGVQIQQEHLGDGSASPVGARPVAGRDSPCIAARKNPKEAFVAVPYEGLWFWIDRRDLRLENHPQRRDHCCSTSWKADSKASPVLTIPTN